MAGTAAQPVQIGLLFGWQMFEGEPDRYLLPVTAGAAAAAAEQGVALTVAAGVTPDVDMVRPAWFSAAPDVDVVPVGPATSHGLIVVDPVNSDRRAEELRALRDQGFPLLVVGAGAGGPRVALDNVAAMTLAVTHLVQHGHQRIAFCAENVPGGGLGDGAERLAGFRAACAAMGASADPALIYAGNHRARDASVATDRFLDTTASFTALIASNDDSAAGVLEVLRARGLRVPEDVAVIGCDDRSGTDAERLTTIRGHSVRLGNLAVATLLAQMRGVPVPAMTRMVPELIVRSSCGCRAAADADTEAGDFGHPPLGRSANRMLWNAEARLLEASNEAEAARRFLRMVNVLSADYACVGVYQSPRAQPGTAITLYEIDAPPRTVALGDWAPPSSPRAPIAVLPLVSGPDGPRGFVAMPLSAVGHGGQLLRQLGAAMRRGSESVSSGSVLSQPAPGSAAGEPADTVVVIGVWYGYEGPDYRRALEATGRLSLVEAETPADAVRLIRRGSSSILLIQHDLSDLAGSGLLAAVRGDPHMRAKRRIVLASTPAASADFDVLDDPLELLLFRRLFTPEELMRRLLGWAEKRPLARGPHRSLRLAMSYINQHHGQPLGLSEVAAAAATSNGNLERIFRSELDLSPVQYLQRVRVARARELLEQRTLRVSDIAFQVGFEDSNYFARVFRRHTGLTPRAYRLAAEENGQMIG